MKVVRRDKAFKEKIDVQRSIDMAIDRLQLRLANYAASPTFEIGKVFGDDVLIHDIINKYCTKKLAKKLADDYEYEGGGYAIWDFRSGYQDGESDIQTVEKIETLGDGKYKVFYNDWGTKGYCIISVVSEGDNILFDEIENSIK